MKAISIRQPWADLIIQGKKTLNLRSRNTRYRGSLAIHAAQMVEQEACQRFGIDADLLTVGAVIGVVELSAVFSIDEDAYQAGKEAHLSHRRYKEGLFGWQLDDPRALPEAAPFKGRRGTFNIPDDLLSMDTPQEKPGISEGLAPPWDPEKPFELWVVPSNSGKHASVPYRLAVYHPIVKNPEQQRSLYTRKPPEMAKVVELGDQALQAVADHVLNALRENGYKATDLSTNRRQPFALSEESGVLLGLLFLAMRRISRMDRIEAISQGLREMTSEELYYWYSKCTTQTTADRAQKALRMLLAEV